MSLIVAGRAVFLHIMKTGGTWVRKALRNGGVPVQEVGNSHLDYAGSVEAGIDPTLPRFTVVRNPYRWYVSFFCHRQATGWGGNLALGAPFFARDTFAEWIQVCTDSYPGFLTEYYGRFVVPGVHTWKTYQLVEGLVAYLNLLSIPFRERALRNTVPVNVGVPRPFLYTAALAEAVYQSEWRVFDRYAYDPDSWRE